VVKTKMMTKKEITMSNNPNYMKAVRIVGLSEAVH